ncbi:SbmA/BacA-like family transporter (plasmid) [Nitrobacter sp. TKz-YC01]
MLNVRFSLEELAIPIVRANRATPMNGLSTSSVAPGWRNVFARFWRSASRFWTGRSAVEAWSLTAFLMIVVLLQLLVQYLLNLWNRHFFDSLQTRDVAALWMQVELLVPLAAGSVLIAVTSVWARMTTQRKWREFLLRHVADYWLSQERFRRLDYTAAGVENPEYRISENVRIATDSPIDLIMALLSSVLTAAVFLSILWDVGGTLNFEAFGGVWSIPGYLVIGVIVYSMVFSGLMMLVGRNLSPVIERQLQAEAELRAAADALRQENGDEAQQSDAEKRGTFWKATHVVLQRWRNLLWELMRTTLVSQGNFLLAPIVAWLLCAPKFVAGTMSLGELTQAAAAFVTVQSAFNWLVDNYSRLADWQASVHRVATFLLALDALGDPESLSEQVEAARS